MGFWWNFYISLSPVLKIWCLFKSRSWLLHFHFSLVYFFICWWYIYNTFFNLFHRDHSLTMKWLQKHHTAQQVHQRGYKSNIYLITVCPPFFTHSCPLSAFSNLVKEIPAYMCSLYVSAVMASKRQCGSYSPVRFDNIWNCLELFRVIFRSFFFRTNSRPANLLNLIHESLISM